MPWKKINLLESLVAHEHVYLHATFFFYCIKRVDKAGLRFYLYLFPFLMANIFILKVFTTVLQTAKKKKRKRKRKKEFRWRVCYYYFLIQINFFRVYRIAGFQYFRQIVVIDRDKNLKTKGLKLIFSHLDLALCQKSVSTNPGHLNILRKGVFSFPLLWYLLVFT